MKHFEPFDQTGTNIKRMLELLPEENPHPSVRADVMNRISDYESGRKKHPLFWNQFLKVSGALVAAGIVAVVAISPFVNDKLSDSAAPQLEAATVSDLAEEVTHSKMQERALSDEFSNMVEMSNRTGGTNS